jgi:hypothetical protein
MEGSDRDLTSSANPTYAWRGSEKTTEYICQDSRFPRRELNLALTKYEEVLNNRSRRSVLNKD